MSGGLQYMPALKPQKLSIKSSAYIYNKQVEEVGIVGCTIKENHNMVVNHELDMPYSRSCSHCRYGRIDEMEYIMIISSLRSIGQSEYDGQVPIKCWWQQCPSQSRSGLWPIY